MNNCSVLYVHEGFENPGDLKVIPPSLSGQSRAGSDQRDLIAQFKTKIPRQLRPDHYVITDDIFKIFWPKLG